MRIMRWLHVMWAVIWLIFSIVWLLVLERTRWTLIIGWLYMGLVAANIVYVVDWRSVHTSRRRLQ